MAIKIGTVDLDQSKIYIGTQEIGAVYVGANKVWPDAPIVSDPVITLLGNNPLTWNLGETFVDPGATALDGKDGDITSSIVATSTVDINTEGSYQVSYNVTDSDGNVAEEVIRVVNVEETEDWTYNGVMTVGQYSSELFTAIGCQGDYRDDYYDYDFGQLTPNPYFENEDYVSFNFLHVFSNTYGWNKLEVALYNENDSGIELVGEVLFNISGVTYTLSYVSTGVYEVVTNNPFPPVGQTCEIKLRYTLAEPEPEPTFPEVTIGTQTWMAVNLDINDGLGGIYAYNNDENNVATYGRLYAWDAAVRVAASIDGWHLPSDAEWQTLSDYLGGNAVSGGKLKETGTTHWDSPNIGATNETGFTALPGGFRYYDDKFYSIGKQCNWWSATERCLDSVFYRYVHYNKSYMASLSHNPENSYSVRLIKD